MNLTEVPTAALQPTSTNLATRIASVLRIHNATSQAVDRFAGRTGIRCPDGCGQCCLSPNVETTVADLLPLAAQLVTMGLAMEVLDRLEASADLRCVLYQPGPEDPGQGRCSMYAWRPSICRLFGFAGRRDADGVPQLSACRVHQQVTPAVVNAAKQAIASGAISLPLFSDHAPQVAAIAPGPHGRLQPINDALREAIHIVGLAGRLNESDQTPTVTDDSTNDGRRPTTPRVRRRKAA